MKNILILNQMRIKDVNRIHGSGYYEALEIANIVDNVVFLAFTKRDKMLYKKVSDNFILLAYPFDLKFENLLTDAIPFLLRLPKITLLVGSLIRKYKISLIRSEGVFLWGTVSFIVKKVYGTPYSVFVVGDELKVLKEKYKAKFLSVLTNLIRFAFIRILKNAKNVATNSIEVYQQLRNLGINVIFLPTYIALNKFECKRELFQDDKVKFLYVGRFDKEKGIEVLLKVIPKLIAKSKAFEFYFVGHGQYEGEIKKLAHMYKEVKYVGFVDNKEMPKWYNETDVLVLPSLTEGMPAVILEAMACKRLVVASSVGSIPFLLKNGNFGLLVPSDDEQSLYDTLSKILESDDKRRYVEIAMNGRKRVEALIDSYKRLIRSLLS
ncbi:MAG: glycosyltransferase family 4 protein [Candidatus Asgardarchaeia archaeon]